MALQRLGTVPQTISVALGLSPTVDKTTVAHKGRRYNVCGSIGACPKMSPVPISDDDVRILNAHCLSPSQIVAKLPVKKPQPELSDNQFSETLVFQDLCDAWLCSGRFLSCPFYGRFKSGHEEN
ncbi:MAG: hypothetical protein ACK4I8_02555 [Armatimonadota bacterium]